MNPAKYAISHQTVVIIFSVLMIIGGIFAYFKIGRLEDPEFTIKEAVIFTYYPGATALEVEQEVTDHLEIAIQQLKQLKEVRSISRAGVSIIFAEMEEIYDKNSLPQVWDELRRKVQDAAGTLPEGCLKPYVNDDFGDVYGVFFAITGDGYSLHELKEIAEDLRKELLLCDDVGRIDFWGIPEEAIYVEINRTKLTQLGLTPTVIINAIEQQNTVADSGKTRVSTENINIRVAGDFSCIEDLQEQLVDNGAGRMIRLKDIATIKRDYIEPLETILRRDGKEAVGLGISTISGGNVIAMGDAINTRLDELRSRIPVGVEIHSIAHQGNTVRESVRGFVINLVAAVFIVLLLLVVFMGIREGIIIGVILLLTIMATLLCMYIMGITLQRISLGALVIALGMLVDNAIVVAEGIVVKSCNGFSRTEAAEETVKETQWPLLGATGISILAFAAISLSRDMTGEWLASLFQVLCLSLGLSWVFAITITPCLCVLFLPDEINETDQSYNNRFYKVYRRFVGNCILHRKLCLCIVVFVLLLAMAGFSQVKQDFMPDMNRNQFTVDAWLPEGTHINATSDQLKQIERYVSSLEGVTDVTSFTGAGPLRFLLTYSPEMFSSSYGMLLVGVEDFRKIPFLANRVLTFINEKHQNIVASADSFKLGPGGGTVEVRLKGSEISVLRSLARQIKTIMLNDGNARTIRTNWGEQVPVQILSMAKSRAQSIGVTRPEIARGVGMNFNGATVGYYRNGEDLLPIMVRPPAEERYGIEHLGNVQVWSDASKRWIAIDQVTDGVTAASEDPVIRRLNRQRVISVLCKPVSGTTDKLFRRLRGQIEEVEIPESYQLEWGGEYEAALEANTKLMSNFPVAFLAMFLITVILFNSLKHPLVIFLCLPLVIVGVAPGMLLADKAFGFMAMLGFLSLFGMLIKNEIVLLEQINLELEKGKAPYQAILDSALSRVRPVSMAAFTTVLGMLPLLWDAFFSPMAVTIMGGLSFATVLTLVVLPVVYATVFGVRTAEKKTSGIC